MNRIRAAYGEGSWFARRVRRGEDLTTAGLLMLAGHVDLGELEHWVRIGWERARRASVPYPHSEDGERTREATTPNGST
jgi:hypothetical protein